jgi:mono/diheme cytochrome c family protein
MMLCAASSLAAGISLRAQDPPPAPAPAARQFTPDEQTAMRRGGAIYRELCFTCHGPDGKGAPVPAMPGAATPPPGDPPMMGPPIAGSARVQGHPDYVIYVLLHGLIGPLEDKTYLSIMAPMGANADEWIAAAASFVRNGFGNVASFVTPEDVAKARAATATRKTPWTFEELKAALPSLAAAPPKGLK